MAPPLPVRALDVALDTIARYNRPDLEARLRQAKARLLDDRVRVLIVGEFKQGKSSLVNGLLEAWVCPVHDDIATPVPTVVRHAPSPSVTLVRAADSRMAPAQQRVEYQDVPEADIGRLVGQAATSAERFSHVEVGLPRRILSGGLEIVDTPGVGGLNSVHGAATMAALPSATAVLLVSDSSQEYTATELEFVRQAIKVCPNVACVLTKTDLYPEWRRIAELDKGHLRSAGIDTDVLAVSSAARFEAARRHDQLLDVESGFPTLVRYLRDNAVAQADQLARRSTVNDILGVTDQLIAGLRAERSAQQNPETAQHLIRELDRARHRSAALKERSARWQQTLNDGVADLSADIDHDLRARMRDILRAVEDEIDGGGDPSGTWEQITTWTEQQAADATSTNFVWATQRARWIAATVAEHFAEEHAEAMPALQIEASDALSSVRDMALRDKEPWGIGQKVLTGLRGGYMGVLMFGLLGTFVGLSMLNPFSVGAGLLLGGKSISDERKRIITRRKQDARQAVRRYLDDALFHITKDSRDMLRQVQRDLRDHFTRLAEETERSLQESQRVAEQSVTATEAQRERRLTEIGNELEHLEKLQKATRSLLPAKRKAPDEAPARTTR
ncbi:MAG: dynamin family protein [Pseudonocardia sp.]|nr:dynamin family protein [Pseudonocardia sp.]